MSTLVNGSEILQFKINHIEITHELILLRLKNGIDLSVKLSSGRALNINKLNEDERQAWQLTEDEFGVYWPAVARPQELACNAMLSAIDLVWEESSDRVLKKLSAANWDLSLLSEIDQNIIALWRLEADIYNGGFMQFFCNWGDTNCQIAISSLGKIGASHTHKIVSRMRELLNRMEDHPEVRELTDIYTVMNDEERAEMQKLDEAFWKDPDGLFKKIVGYYGNYFFDCLR